MEEISDTTAEKAVLEQAQQELERVAVQKTPEEEEASKITEAQIKKYWREKESKRMVKRMHQEDVSIHERVLREFDISSHYGVRTSCCDQRIAFAFDKRIKSSLIL